MRIDVVTLFPAMLAGPLDESILKRARERSLIQISVHNLRDYATDRHRTTDDRPFGGGPGMVLKPEPLFSAIEALRGEKTRVILMSPGGEKLTQQKARQLSSEQHLLIVCGHYEGVDERVVESLIDEEISIGDYVLTNGALPAMVLIDCVARLIPGVLGDEDSAVSESFEQGELDHPQYTRPAEFRGMKVPEVLLSGNHAEIAEWRARQRQKRTSQRRPDLNQEQ